METDANAGQAGHGRQRTDLLRQSRCIARVASIQATSLLVLLAFAASADIIAVGGDALLLKPTTSLDLREGPPWESDYNTLVFEERSYFVMPPNITINAKGYGTYTVPWLVDEVLPAGGDVDSHYIYFDPDVEWFGGWERNLGTVQFSREILGVIAKKPHLMQSHSALGDNHTYPLASDDEGIEYSNLRDADYFGIYQVNGQKLGLLYSFGADSDVDTLRVITRADPPGQ